MPENKHVKPDFGLPYADSLVLPGGICAKVCPVCGMMLSEADATASGIARLRASGESEADYDGFNGKIAGVAYQEHFALMARYDAGLPPLPIVTAATRVIGWQKLHGLHEYLPEAEQEVREGDSVLVETLPAVGDLPDGLYLFVTKVVDTIEPTVIVHGPNEAQHLDQLTNEGDFLLDKQGDVLTITDPQPGPGDEQASPVRLTIKRRYGELLEDAIEVDAPADLDLDDPDAIEEWVRTCWDGLYLAARENEELADAGDKRNDDTAMLWEDENVGSIDSVDDEYIVTWPGKPEASR